MGEYARTGRGMLNSTGGVMAVTLPFEPQFVELINYTAADTPASGGIPFSYWDVAMGQNYAVVETFNATPVLTTNVLTAGGISTFSAGLSLQFGAPVQVVSISKASPASVVATGHGLQTGDVVLFEGLYQSTTTGMPQLCGMPFVVTVSDANTFTIPWNTNQTNYTALSGSPSGAFVKQVLFPYLYAPGASFITSLSLGSTTTVVTTSPHNLVVGSEVAFRIPSVWGTVQLNSAMNVRRPGSPLYGYVSSVINSTSVVVRINSNNFTPFNSNIAVTAVHGLSFPQMIAVGDINTGSSNYSGGALYPSPIVNGSPTINGPAISGAFVNNTSSGFVIGSALAGTAGDDIYWRAALFDYSDYTA